MDDIIICTNSRSRKIRGEYSMTSMIEYVKSELEKEEVKRLRIFTSQAAGNYDKDKIEIEYLDDAIIIREKGDNKDTMRAFPINGMAYLYTSK